MGGALNAQAHHEGWLPPQAAAWKLRLNSWGMGMKRRGGPVVEGEYYIVTQLRKQWRP
jgi:hypothetical protein